MSTPRSPVTAGVPRRSGSVALLVVLVLGAVSLVVDIAVFVIDGDAIEAGRPTQTWVRLIVTGVWALAWLAASAGVIWECRARLGQRDLVGLGRAARILKLGAMPFFVLNFVDLLFWSLEATRHEHVVGFAIAAFVVCTWVVLLPTSAPALFALALLRQERRIPAPAQVALTIGHAVFCLDIVCTMITVVLAERAVVSAGPTGNGSVGRGTITRLLMPVTMLAGALVFVAMIVAVANQPEQDQIGAYVTITLFGFGLWLVVYALVAPWTVLDAALACVRGDLRALRRATLWVKWGSVPFFVMNFIHLALWTFGVIFLSFFNVFAPFFVAPFFVAATYLIFLPTSSHGIACVVRMLLNRQVSRGFGVTHILLHLVFVVDIVSTVLVAMRAKRILAEAASPQHP